MKHFKLSILIILITLISSSCSNSYYNRRTFKYPSPVNTKDKSINLQVKKIYKEGNIFADNIFDGARMNDFFQINDSTYQINIKPENYPINDSPWYSFRIWSDSTREVYLKLNYKNGHHRYTPKRSNDRVVWEIINDSLVDIAADKSYAIIKTKISKNKTWISAEEIINTTDVNLWIDHLKTNGMTSGFNSIGKTKMGRDLPFFRIGIGDSYKKDVIVLLSRQHPPEISGFIAMQSFISELLNKNELSQDFYKKYDIWVFPILNPDGVDLGHWRHNASGVDLNRDWAYYRQNEVNTITKYIVNRAKKGNNKVVLSIDFHSTQNDVYYIFDKSFNTKLHNFVKYWLSSIDRLIYPFKTIHSPEPLSKPYSKVWFYMQFKAESLTYEVGDETDREIIDKKARISAVTMMDLLINGK